MFKPPFLDGITGVAVINNVDGKSDVDIDGKVDYTGTATAENSTGSATATVSGPAGTGNSESLQDMVGVLTVAAQGINSGGDLTINGTTEVELNASATTHGGSASSSIKSDPVKGVKANQNADYQSGGDLTINGFASINAKSVASATGGAGERSAAKSIVNNVIGIDLSGLDSQDSTNNQSTNSHGDLEISGKADVDLHSAADITTGNANAQSFSSLVSGVNAETIVGAGSGILSGEARNSTYATASTTTGDASSLAGLDAEEINNGTQIIGIKDLSLTLHGNSSVIAGTAFNQSIAKAFTTSGDAEADSGLARIVGIDRSTIDVKGSLDESGLVGSATGFFESEAENTHGVSSLATIDAKAVGANIVSDNSYTFVGNGNLTDASLLACQINYC